MPDLGLTRPLGSEITIDDACKTVHAWHELFSVSQSRSAPASLPQAVATIKAYLESEKADGKPIHELEIAEALLMTREGTRHKYRRDKAALREAIFQFFEACGTSRKVFDPVETNDPRLPSKLPSRRAIEQAVITLVIALDLGGGSDFYDLIKAFLWEPDTRAVIEKVMSERKEAIRAVTPRLACDH